MPISVTSVAHGAAAFDATSAAVRRLQGSDRLAPVSVIVPTNTAGVMARRAIGRRGGAAAVDVLTLYRMADLVGAPTLVAEGRKPVSTPVVDLAVKQILRQHPGTYRAVAQHPSTVVALRDLFREVRLAGPQASTALGRTPGGLEPARVITDLTRMLRPGWYDEGDLLAAAIDRIRREIPDRFRRTVVHLAERVRPLELELLRALGEASEVELVVALTGHEEADETVTTIVGALTGALPPLPPARPRPTEHLRVISTTDADDEVRVAVREVLAAARDGVVFDRMALLWPVDRPYARLVEHHLDAADLPWNGRPGTTVAERLVPRLLSELLDLDRRGLRRVPLMTLLGDVPARDRHGRTVPVAQWERIGRRAGVLREGDWRALLPVFAEDAERRERPGDAAAARALLEFVDDLRTRLGDPASTRPWSEWKQWSHDQIEHWVGRRRLDRLDGHERTAWEQTQRVLDRLGHLDTIGGPVTRAEFSATFAAELETVPARRGTVGDGIHIGSLGGSNGLDVDLVVVLGAADGLLPPAPTVDPLLADEDRLRSGLVTSDERVHLVHRRFLAMTTAPRVVVTMPRGDLRATADHQPSRWVDDLVAGREGLHHPVDSHAQALAATTFPVSASEHRLRDLWANVRAGADIRTHPRVADDRVLARALALRDARAADAFTEFDGNLTSRRMPLVDRVVSPTQIEMWASCAHGYFVRYVLGVQDIDEPSEITSMSALDRGSAIHEVLDRLHRRVLDGELAPPGAAGWDATHQVALIEIAAAVTGEFERAGRTGRDAYWEGDREQIVGELLQWMQRDATIWNGRTVRFSERRFGDEERVTVPIGAGREIAFRGSIDRIDELADGSLVVTDHKSGKSDDYRGLEDDPTNDGKHFQLPVYAAAARVLLPDLEPDVPIRVEYSFFDRGGYQRIGLTMDDVVWDQVAHALGRVVDAIETGVFPATPERPKWQKYVKCAFCDPDGFGAGERWGEWDRKRHDPVLSRWFGDPDGEHGT